MELWNFCLCSIHIQCTCDTVNLRLAIFDQNISGMYLNVCVCYCNLIANTISTAKAFSSRNASANTNASVGTYSEANASTSLNVSTSVFENGKRILKKLPKVVYVQFKEDDGRVCK